MSIKRIINYNNLEVEIDDELERFSKVVGYLITKEGYFLSIPDNLHHMEFYRKTLEKYGIDSSQEDEQWVINQLILNLNMAMYFGSEPGGLRNFFLKGKLYLPENFKEYQEMYNSIYNFYLNREFDFDIFNYDIELIKSGYLEKMSNPDDLFKEKK